MGHYFLDTQYTFSVVIIPRISGGDLNEFLPIVVNPRDSTPTSDLTLQFLLETLLDVQAQGQSIGNRCSMA